MNEIMRKDAVRIPKVIKVDIPTGLALRLYKLLENHAQEHTYLRAESSLARLVGHKFWIVWYQAKCWRGQPDRMSFACLTGYWLSFTKRVLEGKLENNPRDKQIQQLLECINNGREVKSC